MEKARYKFLIIIIIIIIINYCTVPDALESFMTSFIYQRYLKVKIKSYPKEYQCILRRPLGLSL